MKDLEQKFVKEFVFIYFRKYIYYYYIYKDCCLYFYIVQKGKDNRTRKDI